MFKASDGSERLGRVFMVRPGMPPSQYLMFTNMDPLTWGFLNEASMEAWLNKSVSFGNFVPGPEMKMKYIFLII